MNKLLFLPILVFTLAVFGQKNPIIQEYAGCFHGAYESFHDNGNTKAKGNFYFNRRIGDWKVFDEFGKLLVHRFYDSLGHVKIIVPKTADDEVIKLLNQPRFRLHRDSIGKYVYQHISEGDVVWSKRVWSYFPVENNETFYAFDWLGLLNRFELQEDLSSKRIVTVYKNDQFSKFYEDTEEIATQNFELLGIGLKKDYFYDIASRKMDARVLAVTLFIKDTTNTIRKDLTLYLPTDLRPFLVKQIIQHEDPAITNLDDLIYFNAYNEIIYKEESWKEKTVQLFHPKDANNFSQFSKEVKIQIIEEEHSYWVAV